MLPIPALLAACLLSDPALGDPGSALASSGIGRAGVQAFDSSLLAADPKLDPAKTPLADEGSDKPTFSYTWVEMGYGVTQIHDLSDHTEGFYGRGSFAFLKYFHLLAGVSRETSNFDDVVIDSYELGGGVHLSMLPKLDLIGEASWLWNRIDSQTIFTDEHHPGVSLFAGARFMALDWQDGGLEANGGFRYINQESLLGEKASRAWELGARAHFMKIISVGATYDYIESDQRFMFDVRFSF